MATGDYYQQIAQLRQERHQRESVQRLNEIATEHGEVQRERDEAARNNDADSFEYYDSECERLEREFAKLKPPPALSDKKQQFIAQRWDIPYSKQNVDLANGAHLYITQAMGVPDDSPQYFELLRHVIEPAGYQPPISPDEVCKNLNLSPKEYNRQVRKLAQAKASGAYRDR